MLDPLRISFVVDCTAEHAFETWTERASAWWPPEHTVSHERGAKIVFEPRPGGKIFERTASGDEIWWGEIVTWEPPHRLRYLWHIAADRASATDVEIVFQELNDSTTRVEIEHGGWDRLGKLGPPWREANVAGWDGVLPSYQKETRVNRQSRPGG